jgi:hypothetical protein
MRRHAVTVALGLLTVVGAILVVPGMHATGALQEIAPLELGSGASPPLARQRGPVTEDVDGFRVAPGGEAVVTVPVTLPPPANGRTLLRVWAYGPPGVRTTAVLRAADGSQRPLGRATNWVGQTFDVTDEARQGAVDLRVRAQNSIRRSVLFYDRIAPVAAPGSLTPSAHGWEVGLLVLLMTAALLGLAGRLRRHWALAMLLGVPAAVLWDDVRRRALESLPLDAAATWTAATDASWFGFHDGLLWGSWTSLSSLAVQIFHALTPLVGTAPVSARAAAVLTALLALAAIYALGHRAAGRTGAVLALVLAMLTVRFQDAAVAAGSLPALVLAGTLFAYALHACLAEGTPVGLAMLGAAAALLALAEPTWLPGALLAVVIVGLACAVPRKRLPAVAAGLLAAAVLLVPHLASTASQNDGRMFANLDARAVAARNAEFPAGEHGAPTAAELARDPLGGRTVSIAGYVFAEHSVGQVLESTVAGANRSIKAYDGGDRRGALGTAVLFAGLVGTLFVVMLPRLRLLVLLAAPVVVPTLFIADRTTFDPASAGAVLWPVTLACAGVLAYTVGRLAIGPLLPGLDALRARRRHARISANPPAAPDHRRT